MSQTTLRRQFTLYISLLCTEIEESRLYYYKTNKDWTPFLTKYLTITAVSVTVLSGHSVLLAWYLDQIGDT